MKRSLYILLTYLLTLSACSDKIAGGKNYSEHSINGMLGRESQRISRDNRNMALSKTIIYNGKAETKAVDSTDALHALDLLRDMELDRITTNTSFSKDSAVIGSFGKAKLAEVKYRLKEDENYPIVYMATYKLIDEGGHESWQGLFINRAEANYLFHSRQSYALSFANGQVHNLTVNSFEKTVFYDPVSFRMRMDISAQ